MKNNVKLIKKKLKLNRVEQNQLEIEIDKIDLLFETKIDRLATLRHQEQGYISKLVSLTRNITIKDNK